MQSHLHAHISRTLATPGNERMFFMGKKSKTITVEVGRDAINGKFITVAEAERRHDTAIVQHIKRPANTQKK